MMTYVYAITDRPEEPLPGQLGLDDADLCQIACRDIGAVVSIHDSAPPAATADQVWRHEEVVEALMSARAVLPARFGTVFPSRQRVGDMLCRTYPRFIQDIDRVRGHVEIGVRFMPATEHRPEADLLPGFASPGSAPGTMYLHARSAMARALRKRRQVQLAMVREAYATLASHATASSLDAADVDREGVSASFLVRRDCLASFQAIIGRVADGHPELLLLCTGPWPPYSFVSVNAGEPAGRGGGGHAH